MYEVRLVGEQAKLGEVSAGDVGKLLIGLQSVLARAAGSAIGRRGKTRGRWERVVEEATRLRLVGLRHGSVVVELDLPPAEGGGEDALELSAETLGTMAWRTALTALETPEAADLGLVSRLSRLAEDLAIGDRYDALEFGESATPASRRIKMDQEGRRRLALAARLASRQTAASAAVAGVLVEADFEKMTAHVRTATNDLVELIFDAELADEIYDALRQRSEFVGDVVYDALTNSVKSVQLRRLTRTEQLLLGDEATAFWRDVTAEELIEEQGKGPVTSFSGLRDTSLSDEEFESFLASLD
jgi:hypothetical protein